MKRYQVFVDVAPSGDWESPYVEILEIEGHDPESARDAALMVSKEKHPNDELYVWNVNKEDQII